MNNKKQNIDPESGLNLRHIAQIVRRNGMTKVYKDVTKYTRKQKHKK